MAGTGTENWQRQRFSLHELTFKRAEWRIVCFEPLLLATVAELLRRRSSTSSARRRLVDRIKANQSGSWSKRVGVWALPKLLIISHSVPTTSSLLQLGEQEGASGAVVVGRGERTSQPVSWPWWAEAGRAADAQRHCCYLSSGVVPDVILNLIPKILLETERKNIQTVRIQGKQQCEHLLQERKNL